MVYAQHTRQIHLQNIHDDTQRPHVTGLVILFWTKNLWGYNMKSLKKWKGFMSGNISNYQHPSTDDYDILTNIIRSIARGRQRVVCGRLLCKPKVCQFEKGIGPFRGI